MNSYEKFAAISALDPDASIKYSDWTKQVYVDLPYLEIGDGCFLRGITKHADTFEEAIDETWETLTNLNLGEYLVLHATNTKKRKHFRWNGYMWEDLHWIPKEDK